MFKKIAASCVLVLAAGNANALIIDHFTVDQSASAVAGVDSSNVAGAGLGTSRDLTVSNAAGQTQAFINSLQPSILDMSNTTTAAGTVTVDWTGIANVDLTEGATATGIFLSIPSAIDNSLDVTFTINGASSDTVSFANGASGNDFFIPFAGFSDPSAFNDVTTISAVFTGPLGWDASIDFIETRPNPPTTSVPAPTPLLLMGLGLVGFAARRRMSA